MRKWQRKEKLGVEEAMFERIQMEERGIEKAFDEFVRSRNNSKIITF